MAKVSYNDLLDVIQGIGTKLRDNLWLASKQYKVGDFIIHGNLLYRVHTAFTSGSTFSDTNLTLIGDGDTKIEDWSGGTSYSVGDLVIYNNELYQCITANSDSTWVTAKWQLIGGGGTTIADWTASTSYAIGDLVIYNNGLYKCITANSDSSWTANKWQIIGDGDTKIEDWSSGTSYAVGDLVIYSNELYQCITANSDSSWTSSKWQLIGNSGGTTIADWSSGTSYSVGDLVIYNNELYKCTTANSDSVWTPSKWQLIGSSGTSIADWVASSSYSVGDLVIYSNSIWKCITANSDSTWDATNWQELGSGNDFTGATASTNGVRGLVPAPTTSDVNKFLKGDGTWGAVSGGGGVNAIIETLYEVKQKPVLNSVINFSDDVSNYDYLVFYGMSPDSYGDYCFMSSISPSDSAWLVLQTVDRDTIIYGCELQMNGTSATITAVKNFGANDWIKVEGWKFVNSNEYSTTEKRIGTWIDGKPLYQKTFTGTFTSKLSSTSQIIGNIGTTVDAIVAQEGSLLEYTSGGAINYYDITYTEINSSGNITYLSNFFVEIDSGDIVATGKTWPAGTGFNLTIKYTKV